MILSRYLAAYSVLATLVFASSAGADPIKVTITSGQIRASGSESAGADVHIVGTQGFSLQGTAAPAFLNGQGCDPCIAGFEVPFGGSVGSSFGGSATFRGHTFPVSPENDDSVFLGFSSDAFATLPEDFDSATFTPSGSFALSGDLLVHDRSGNSRLSLVLEGFGQETATFAAARQFGEQDFFTQGFVFDFGTAAPTPEPPTWVLLAVCLTAVAGGRRLKRALPLQR